MSAPKRTREKKAVRLQPHDIPEPPASFRKNVLNYPKAQLAFASVAGARLNEELFWKMLWELACRKEDGKSEASRWYSLSGHPVHTLRRLPRRVRSWADEIEVLECQIRSNWAYGHAAASLPLFRLSKPTELPSLLRLYADRLEVVCKFTARHGPKAPSRFRANLEFALIEYVKLVTGRPHTPEIATLLTGAYHAQGSNEIVDAHNLTMRYSRHTRRKQ